MTLTEQKVAAKKFAAKWAGKGDEKQDTRSFWEEFMEDVLGISGARDLIDTEYPVLINGHTKYIDVFYKEQKILIEQKSIGKSLNKRYHQSGGEMLTPFEQGRRYAGYLPYGENPRWIIACNFQQFEIHDLKKPGEAPLTIELKDLSKDIGLFRFFFSQQDEELKRELDISIEAGEIVGRLYEALREKYVDPDSVESQRYLNILVTRLVFCMYAEDAGLFGDEGNRFQKYISSKNPDDIGEALERLFRVLDMPEDERDKHSNLSSALKSFAYVNGGLFAEEEIEIPVFDEKLKRLLVEDACAFNWSEISPTIFGAVFESTLNPETRRSGGMHYTSIENIHKVIDPLFLDALKEEFQAINATADRRGYKNRLLKFQEKLSSLTFLDPACGSGNFLTETFLCLRRLENQVIAEILGGQQAFGDVLKDNPIHVSIDQFYGIEINDFAVTVARTALWIAEAQMLEETEEIIRSQIEFFPLKTNAYIVEGNALQMDWNGVIPNTEVDFIMGNPPFSAGRRMGDSQRKDMNLVAKDFPKNGELDYVCCWYIKAAEYMQGSSVRTGFVSTSSICQGEQVVLLWKRLFEIYHVEFEYVVKSFNWESEAKKTQAGVHCIVIEFHIGNTQTIKTINDNEKITQVRHINGYLIGDNDVWVEAQKKSVSGAPVIGNGSKPLDNAICAFTPEEKEAFIKAEPKSADYFWRYMGSKEFINNIERYFLLCNRIPIEELAKMPKVREKLEEVKQYRLSSNSKQTYNMANTPAKFHFENIPDHDYLVIPQTSSGRRRYIPIGFLSKNVLVNNKLQIMRDGGLYELGILSSNVHNAWLRMVAGRFREDYTYSVSVVYNTFPWPEIDDKQKAIIVQSAQGILDCRASFPKASLATLYDEALMPVELRKAHQNNDKAVMEAYGFFHTDDQGKKHWYTEEETVAALMKMYQKLTQPMETTAPKKPKATVKVKVHRKQ